VLDSIKVIIIIFTLVMSRIFIALTPNPEFNKVICELKEDQKKFLIRNHKVNWSKDNQHHITMNFIGSMEPEQKEELFTNLENRSAFKNLPIEIDSLSYFPNENGQVLIANIAPTPRLQKLFDEVDKIVARIGFGMALRTFRPHITLARFKDKNRPFSQFVEIEEPVDSIIKALDVYESSFKSGKTSHTLIQSYSFE
jgi:2'-5' RNA ligase